MSRSPIIPVRSYAASFRIEVVATEKGCRTFHVSWAISRIVFFAPISNSQVRMLSLGGSHLLNDLPSFLRGSFWSYQNLRRPQPRNQRPCQYSLGTPAQQEVRQRSGLILEQRMDLSLSAKNLIENSQQIFSAERDHCFSSRARSPDTLQGAR